MEYLNETELKRALNQLAKIEEQAADFTEELNQNGKYTNQDILSFIENPKNVQKTVREVGYNEALNFSIASQREILEKQADVTASRLMNLSERIFSDVILNYNFGYPDIEKACYMDKGVFKIDVKKAKQLLTKKFTYELSPIQHEFYNKVDNFCRVLNSLNTYADNMNTIPYVDVNTKHYQFIRGGLNAFNERNPYEVNIENILKYIHK